jgi:hypothetical protein
VPPQGSDGKEAKEASVRVLLESSVSDIGVVGNLALPEKFLPDADKPPGIAEALRRFGLKATDAGVPQPEEAGEPEDDS